ncbi:MAG: glycosyltransferase [Lentisphaerae bacterium]|nr:glycosyltransferase [Lentisphaerota bacterium]
MPPPVTIIMSVYNGAQYLREAVDVILRQTFRDFEFLIVNDGSTDASAAILESFHDPRIRTIHNAANRGLTASLNIALRQARGVYIARQDADDISYPDRLAHQVEFLSTHDSVAAVGTRFHIQVSPRPLEESGRPLPAAIATLQAGPPLLNTLPTHPHIIQYSMMRNNMFCHGSVMFRRAGVESIGGYHEHFFVGQDYDLWLRLAEIGDLANLPTADYFWRQQPEQISVRRRAEHNAVRAEIQRLAWQRQADGIDALQRRLPAPDASDRPACSRLFTWSLAAYHYRPDAFAVTQERWRRYCRENGFDPRDIAREVMGAIMSGEFPPEHAATLPALWRKLDLGPDVPELMDTLLQRHQPRLRSRLALARDRQERVVVFPAGQYARKWLPLWHGLFADVIAGWYDDRAPAPLDGLPKIAPDSSVTVLLAAESAIPALMERARVLFGSRAAIITPDGSGE